MCLSWPSRQALPGYTPLSSLRHGGLVATRPSSAAGDYSAVVAHFPSLSPASFHEHTETAQRFLASAYDSVSAVLYNLSLFRTWRRNEGQDLRGRLTEN